MQNSTRPQFDLDDVIAAFRDAQNTIVHDNAHSANDKKIANAFIEASIKIVKLETARKLVDYLTTYQLLNAPLTMEVLAIVISRLHVGSIEQFTNRLDALETLE